MNENIVNTIQNKGVEIIQNKGFHVQELVGTQDDYDGVDLIVSDDNGKSKKVDMKVDSTLSTIFYPTDGYTGLISLMHHKGNGVWRLPKYLERNDVYVWLIDDINKLIWEISPKMLSSIGNYIIDTKMKNGETDYFGRTHLLGVIPLSQCRLITSNKELYPRFYDKR